MKKALITGGSSGLGVAMAKALLKHNSSLSLLLTGRDKEKLLSIQEELSSYDVTTLVLDLLKPHDKKELVTWIEHHNPDLVINNAGIGLYGDALSHSIEEQLNILELNANVVLELSLHAAKAILAHKKTGTIMNISSATDQLCYPTFSVYAASKAFVTSFSKSFDEELKPHGIRVLVSSPGQINTDFRKHASKGYFQKPSSTALSCEEAAKEIIWQIQKEKKTHVFPTNVRICRYILLRCLPEWILSWILKRSLKTATNTKK